MQRLDRRRTVATVALATFTAITLAACGGQSSDAGSGGGGGSHTSGSSGYGATSGYGSSSKTSSSTSGTSGASPSGATIHLTHTSAGNLVVDAHGSTLYLFTADHPSHDTCVTVHGCASVWPPLTVSGHPTAGSGLKGSLLGTIKLYGGRRQVTYAAHPLYLYSGAGGPGVTSYIGYSSFGGTWLAVGAGGQAVH